MANPQIKIVFKRVRSWKDNKVIIVFIKVSFLIIFDKFFFNADVFDFQMQQIQFGQFLYQFIDIPFVQEGVHFFVSCHIGNALSGRCIQFVDLQIIGELSVFDDQDPVTVFLDFIQIVAGEKDRYSVFLQICKQGKKICVASKDQDRLSAHRGQGS